MTMLTAKQAYIRLEFLRGLGYYSPVLPDTMLISRIESTWTGRGFLAGASESLDKLTG